MSVSHDALFQNCINGSAPLNRRRYPEEQFCEIMNLDQWFRRKCRLKVFLIWSSDSPFVQRSVTICAIMVEGIMRNNSVKLFGICVSDSGRDVV